VIANISLFDSSRDSLREITDLLHRAYGALAVGGLNYAAATQPVETTESRIRTATCAWVARSDTGIVGTICYYAHRRFASEPQWYERDDTCHFGQVAVEPSLQREGIGSSLLLTVEERARADAKTEFSCDTAVGAASLIAYYQRRGFHEVAKHQWPQANYLSVVLSKRLG
jgi:GNAT superfamily N-acetyltransferase